MPDPPLRVLNLFVNMDRGGAETLVMNHYRHLDRSRVQFDFLVQRAHRGAYEDEIEALGGHIFRVPPLAPSSFLEHQAQLRAFFQGHPGYPIVHGHCSEVGCFAYREAARAGVRVRIAHAHLAPAGLDWKSLPRWFLKKLGNRWSTHAFACSEVAAAWLFGPGHAYQPMANAIDTRLFRHDPERRLRTRSALDIAPTTAVLGHIGRFDPQKNHERLLSIFDSFSAMHPDSILLLVGSGALRPAMEARAEALGLVDKVRFLGTRDDTPALLDAMDAFLFPSRYEGLPVTVIEAQASGLPIVLSSSISRECDLTGALAFLPLATPDEIWAKAVLAAAQQGRAQEADRLVAAAGFDIEQGAQWLLDWYEAAHASASADGGSQ